jgi:hypothetical protein
MRTRAHEYFFLGGVLLQNHLTLFSISIFIQFVSKHSRRFKNKTKRKKNSKALPNFILTKRK